MLTSAWLLLAGTFKRWFVWAPAVLLVLAELYDTFLRERSPPERAFDLLGGILSYGVLVLGVLVVAAACRTFHELRRERDELLSKLEKREARRQKSERLAEITGQAQELRKARVSSELEWLAWVEAFEEWVRSSTEQIEGYFTVSDDELFKDTTDIEAEDIVGTYSPEHNDRLLRLGKYIHNLRKLMDRYED